VSDDRLQFIQNSHGGFLHVAERAITPDLPEWRKMPFCRNGGLNLMHWDFVLIVPGEVYKADVCGACRLRLAHKKIEIRFAEYGTPHDHFCFLCDRAVQCEERELQEKKSGNLRRML
jgi:hypothetical protein